MQHMNNAPDASSLRTSARRSARYDLATAPAHLMGAHINVVAPIAVRRSLAHEPRSIQIVHDDFSGNPATAGSA